MWDITFGRSKDRVEEIGGKIGRPTETSEEECRMANEAINGHDPYLNMEHLGTAKAFNVGITARPAAFIGGTSPG